MAKREEIAEIMGRDVAKKPSFKVKVVSLGGWLVIESWMTPSLFDSIPFNKDLLDGTKVQLKSVTTGKYVSAENGGGSVLVANRTSASDWESFKLWRIDDDTFNFRVFNNLFAGVQSSESEGITDSVVTTTSSPGETEWFRLIRESHDTNITHVRIQAPNGFFLQVAKTQDLVTADYEGDGGWGDDNPSVIVMTIYGFIGGEYQLTNGYGPHRAPQVMKIHHSCVHTLESVPRPDC